MIDELRRFIVVTPVFEDIEAASRLFHALSSEFGDGVFVVAVDDGSVSQPLEISRLADAGLAGIVLRLRCNVGHQRAIAVGLAYVSEHLRLTPRVVVMDSDGEDSPATISQLLARLESEHADVVVAQRKSRADTLRFKAFYWFYKELFGLVTGRAINFGNFMALKDTAVRRLVAMPELSIHLAGAVLASRLRTSYCPLDRYPRYAGQSKMTFSGLALHGFKSLMVFAEVVLVRISTACAAGVALAIAGALAAAILETIGCAAPNWFFFGMGILGLIFLQTGALTLMALMLTGIVRCRPVTTAIAYGDLVDEVVGTSKQPIPS